MTEAEKKIVEYEALIKDLTDALRATNRTPLKPNKADMEGLSVEQRLAFKLGWKLAEEAHNIVD